MDVITLALLPILGLAIAAVIYVVTRILRSPELNETERVVWVLAVVFFPVVGTLVWFLAGPHPFGLRIQRDLR